MHFAHLLVAILLGAEPEAAARAITLDAAPFADASYALHITSRSGTVELTSERFEAVIEVEFYKNGKKSPKKFFGCGFKTTTPFNAVAFAVHVVDMDYLPLGNGKPGHCRLILKTRVPLAETGVEMDIPNDLCDLSNLIGCTRFTPPVGTTDSVPIFWLLGNTNSMITGNTPEELVKNNPVGDIAIFYLRLPHQELTVTAADKPSAPPSD